MHDLKEAAKSALSAAKEAHAEEIKKLHEDVVLDTAKNKKAKQFWKWCDDMLGVAFIENNSEESMFEEHLSTSILLQAETTDEEDDVIMQ